MHICKQNRKTGTLLGACLIIFACLFLAVPANAAAVALTFDDGPHPKYTPQILEILDRYNIKATFFVIGINAKNYPKDIDYKVLKERLRNERIEWLKNHTI